MARPTRLDPSMDSAPDDPSSPLQFRTITLLSTTRRLSERRIVMSLLNVPTVPGSPPTRWLIGWRRLWIVVAVVSLPITLFSAARLNPRSELERLLDAEEAARKAA